MAPLAGLPADQRAVLHLVLRRGRSYDEIAQLLSMDRVAVRERALAAFDALGPVTRVPAERRALITDYLLGQLPDLARDEARTRLAASASERAWARALLPELAPLASSALPDLPVETALTRELEADAQGETEDPSGPRRRFRLGAAGLLGALVVIVAIALTAGATPSPPAASARPDSGIAYVSIVHHSNVAAVAAGESVDRILGDEAAAYSLTLHRVGPSANTLKLVSKVVFYSPTGSMRGTATANMTVSAKAEIFTSGELSLNDGAGSQKGHSLIATFSGTGSLSANLYILHYIGTYK
jgi:hypothetical protein